MIATIKQYLNKIINLLKAKSSAIHIKHNTDIDDKTNNTSINNYVIDYSKYDDVDTLNSDTKAETVLFIMDDIIDSLTLYNIDLDRVDRNFDKNTRADYKIVTAMGRTAGFKARKYIYSGGRVDYGILDITLGYVIKLENGEHLEIDGIDIAIDLIEHNPNIKFVFSTAHTLNRRNPDMKYYFNKFELATGRNIEDHYMNKNSSRYKTIHTLLYGDKDANA